MEHFPDKILECVARLNLGNDDFKNLIEWLEVQGTKLAFESLTMSGEDMYKKQGAALHVQNFVAAVENAAETIRVKTDRKDQKTNAAIERQFRNM